MPDPMIHDLIVPVLRNVDLGRGNHLLEFEAGNVADAMQPAQFFMIGVPGSDVLLRRPFSVCGLPGTFADGAPGAVQVLYRVYGRGTRLLASLGAGAELHVLGPLGRGFTIPAERDSSILLVAGGIGSAPFPAFLAQLARAGLRAAMIYGARSHEELPLLDWFQERCEAVTITTDDGSLGARGRVTDPLGPMLRRRTPGLHVYACGPTPMLRAVAAMTVSAGVRCDLALEAPMACGFGVCLGCVVPTRESPNGPIAYERVCLEGPVMPAERVAW
jgi:dihydroorotate dehydrogenase electron transfer subunit